MEMSELKRNFSVIESVKCTECGRIHKREDETYLTVYGNITVGECGGILGGGNWGAYGVPVNVMCKPCLVGFIEKARVAQC